MAQNLRQQSPSTTSVSRSRSGPASGKVAFHPDSRLGSSCSLSLPDVPGPRGGASDRSSCTGLRSSDPCLTAAHPAEAERRPSGSGSSAPPRFKRPRSCSGGTHRPAEMSRRRCRKTHGGGFKYVHSFMAGCCQAVHGIPAKCVSGRRNQRGVSALESTVLAMPRSPGPCRRALIRSRHARIGGHNIDVVCGKLLPS